jgi:hypothetical protein
MDDQGTIVTVLGAGATAACGYPLAQQLFPRLSEYGNLLGDNCQRLRSAIDHVVTKAAELGCSTPDDLARRMHHSRHGGTQNYYAALKTLFYSRIATDAFFLHLESQITDQAMESVKNLWHQILDGFSHDWTQGLRRTQHRLTSFDYDRVPELVFARHFSTGGQWFGGDLYSPAALNSGFALGASEISDEGFCYLKLHGTVGVRPFGDNDDEALFDQFYGQYAPFGSPLEISDELYFDPNRDDNDFKHIRFCPLVVFPADKQRVESGGQEYNLARYVKSIRAKADQIFSHWVFFSRARQELAGLFDAQSAQRENPCVPPRCQPALC